MFALSRQVLQSAEAVESHHREVERSAAELSCIVRSPTSHADTKHDDCDDDDDDDADGGDGGDDNVDDDGDDDGVDDGVDDDADDGADNDVTQASASAGPPVSWYG